jgi:pglZ domain protein
VSEGQYKIIMPYAYDLFKTQGGGIQYVHGGASLQEIVVPIIHISELRATKNVETVAPVGIRLKSITRKITNRSFTLDFEQTEKVEDKKQPITCETFFIDEKENVVSGVYKFVANSSSDDPESRINRVRFTLKNIDFDRNKKYFLVLRNAAKQDEFIEREQFIIDILGFKIF